MPVGRLDYVPYLLENIVVFYHTSPELFALLLTSVTFDVCSWFESLYRDGKPKLRNEIPSKRQMKITYGC